MQKTYERAIFTARYTKKICTSTGTSYFLLNTGMYRMFSFTAFSKKTQTFLKKVINSNRYVSKFNSPADVPYVVVGLLPWNIYIYIYIYIVHNDNNWVNILIKEKGDTFHDEANIYHVLYRLYSICHTRDDGLPWELICIYNCMKIWTNMKKDKGEQSVIEEHILCQNNYICFVPYWPYSVCPFFHIYIYIYIYIHI